MISFSSFWGSFFLGLRRTMEYCARFSGGPIGLALLCQLLLMTDNTGSCVTLFASAGSACVRKGTYARQLRVGGLPTQTERPDSDLTVPDCRSLQLCSAVHFLVKYPGYIIGLATTLKTKLCLKLRNSERTFYYHNARDRSFSSFYFCHILSRKSLTAKIQPRKYNRKILIHLVVLT